VWCQVGRMQGPPSHCTAVNGQKHNSSTLLIMYYSLVDAMPLGLCVNHEEQISGQHPTGKERTRIQSCSPPAPLLLLEENPRMWRGSRGALGRASASALVLADGDGDCCPHGRARSFHIQHAGWCTPVLSQATPQSAAAARDPAAGCGTPFSQSC